MVQKYLKALLVYCLFQFWLKYVYMEETLGNVPGARQIFERWMEWEPGEQAWQTYINFELRYKEIERARQIWQRFLHIHQDAKNWIRYARFEERSGFVTNARHVYERAVEFFGEFNVDEKLLIAFAQFEENQKEVKCLVILFNNLFRYLVLSVYSTNGLASSINTVSIICLNTAPKRFTSTILNTRKNTVSDRELKASSLINVNTSTKNKSRRIVTTMTLGSIICVCWKMKKLKWKSYETLMNELSPTSRSSRYNTNNVQYIIA